MTFKSLTELAQHVERQRLLRCAIMDGWVKPAGKVR